jgi:hypothetical protein
LHRGRGTAADASGATRNEPSDRARWQELFFPAYCLASYVAVTLTHWSQVQSYPTHQTVLTGFAVVFIALLLAPAVNVVAERYRTCRHALGTGLRWVV